MKAAKLFGARDTRVVETETPQPAPHEVLVHVRAVAICASDIDIYKNGCASGGVYPPGPMIQGHELSGEVAALGEAADAPPVGARVAVEPSWYCGECDLCREGLTNLCRNIVFPSYPPRDGALAEYIACPGFSVEPLPAEVSDIEGALTEPLGVGIHAVRLAELSGQEKVGILGAGMIGISTMLAAQVQGIDHLYVAEPVAERRAVAAEYGATVTAASAAELIEAGIEPEVIFECSGDNPALGQSLDLVRPAGQVIMVGIPHPSEVCFNCERSRRNQITIKFSRRSLHTLKESVELIAVRKVDLSRVPVRTFSLDETPRAMEIAAAGPGPELRLVVIP